MTDTINRLRLPILLVTTLALALLAILGALLLPATAQAQTETTLVSNIGQGNTEDRSGIRDSQRFTTGANAGGYTLTAVEVVSARDVPTSDTPFSATVCGTDASGNPTTDCTALTVPVGYDDGDMVSLTASPGIALMKETTYTVVFASQTISATTEDGEDSGGESDWSIANLFRWSTDSGTTWTDHSMGVSLRIAIKGYKGIGTPGAPAAPTDFQAEVGDTEVELSWDAPASDADITRHEFRYKMGTGSYPTTWTQIANSAPGGANQKGYTVGSLTNEVVHTFQLRGVNTTGNGLAAEADPVTPTPGICDRTAKIQEVILAELAGVTDCKAVTVANLASITSFGTDGVATLGQGITTLMEGDFAGLTSLTVVNLFANGLTALPVGIFSDLTAVTSISLEVNSLAVLPEETFAGLANLDLINLNSNNLTAIPAGAFANLSLSDIQLSNNDLTSLPDGLFSGLTGLTNLTLISNPNTDDTLPLTVTVEKVGTDQVRAKVLAGAPFAVAIPVTVANGSLPSSATTLTVAAGAVDGTPVTVTRTSGAAVTVDVDLSTQPTLPTNHSGYEFEKAASGLPAAILPAVPEVDDVEITSTPVLDTDTYGAGERIEVSVTFSEAVNATSDTDFVLSTGWGKQPMPLVDGSGTATLVFGYTVAPGDEDDDGVFIGKEEVTLVGDRSGDAQTGEITSAATGEPAFIDHSSSSHGDHKVDGTRSIVSVAVTSTPQLETDTYGAGETILFTVTFNVAVDVTGDPVFRFALGDSGDTPREVDAAYVSGTGSTALVFGYTVVSSDSDNNGIFLRDGTNLDDPDGPVRPDSDDEIEFKGTSTDVPLLWSGRGTESGHQVDGSRSSVPAQPTNFTAAPDGSGKVTLSWDTPATGVTSHEFRHKTGNGAYPATYTPIANSGAGGANEDGFTVTGLTDEVVHTFELRAVNALGESTAVESDPVTPTPGICDRTQQVQDEILVRLSGVDDCAAVTVADLATVTELYIFRENVTALKSGDFAGLSTLDILDLRNNALTGLPSDVFAGLSTLTELNLSSNSLSSLPSGVFSGLAALEILGLNGNPSLGPLPAGVFSGLASLQQLTLNGTGLDTVPAGLFSGLSDLTLLNLDGNGIESLPAAVFSDLVKLDELFVRNNSLAMLPDGVFSRLTVLKELDLSGNDLTSLPDGLFSGLTALTTLYLGDNPNTGDVLPLTVTVEKVGDDRARAKVLAGAPFDVDFTATVANGALGGGETVLSVPKGLVDGTPAVTVTRTEGTTNAVTVDIDLSTQPALPNTQFGYEFARSSDLPVEILEEEASLDPPTNLAATAGDREAVLTWTPPAADSGYTQHQYRYREGNGNWEHWTTIPDSGPNEANASRYTVTGLKNATEHTFELRVRDAGAGKSGAATTKVTPQGPPRILTVQVVSGPGLDDGQTYGAGEEIRIEVTFDQPVVVTGDPELEIEVGSASRHAQYDSGGGTEVLVFVYLVQAGDSDNDGIEVGADALRLDSNDGIRNPSDDDAERTHAASGTQSGHMVNGSRRGDVHEHGESTHSHSVFNTGKRYYTETYLEHTHDGHEHSNTANDHPHPRDGHDHHVQPNLRGEFGPDLRSHGGVEHIHRCFSLKPSCNQSSDYNRRGDELGLPIEVTHSHHGNSEPGHGFDWTAFFEAGGSGAAVSVADAGAVGGKDAHLRFVVTLEPALAFAVRVQYATADGTAAAGEDYTETSGTLEIPPGETRATVRVPVRDRESTDGDETLTLTLRSATAVTVADGEATGTIRAPEPTTPPKIDDIDVVSTPRLRSQGASKEDTYGEGENIRIEVRFDQPVVVEGEPVMALQVCDPGEPVCEVEARYESGSGTDTLVFAYLVLEVDVDRNGIAIPADPVDVSVDDFDGFSIRNAAGQEAGLSYRREGTKSGHKVNGSRHAGQYLWVEDAEAHEADGEMTFTVRLEPRGLGIVTVDYATRDGTARAGLDYTETRGRLRFNSLERERTVTVTVIDDLVPDDGETFKLRLSNPDGATLRSADREAAGTIHNSDPPALSASFPASAFASSSHSGADDRPQAVVAFSEPVAEFAADTPSVSVTGGAVDSVQPHTEDGLEHAWLFVLAPGGDGDVTFALVADAACAGGGICTPDGRALTEAPEAATIPGPGDAEEPSEPPAKPRGLEATATHDAITLIWDAPQDESITGYVILRRDRDNDAEGHFDELAADTGTAATTYTDATVSAETRYTYRIKAINQYGASERSRWYHIATPAAPEPETPPEPDNSPATGAPSITGTVQVGETLTANTSGIADADGLSNVRYEYQWLADNADISGATNATYTLADTDEGKAVKVQVSFTDDASNGETLTSAATAAVAAAEPTEPPSKPRGLSATATHGQVVLTWNDPQDDSITGYVILRRVRVNDQGGDFSVLVADTGSAATTYTDTTVAASTTYTYRIKAINEHGTSERSRWVHIDTPAAPEPEEKESAEPPDKPRGLDATASHGQVVLTWDDPDDDSIIGYVILRRVRVNDQGGDFSVLVADTGSAATTYTDTTVADSTTYTYRIKAINEAGTSERSRWVHIDTPAAA